MTQTVYVLTLKTWSEWDRAHHTYGRVHWEVPDRCGHAGRGAVDDVIICTTCGLDCSDEGFHSDDVESLPDDTGFCSIRHDTRSETIDSARRWFAARSNPDPDDVLLVGTWGLAGWDTDAPIEILEGKLRT